MLVDVCRTQAGMVSIAQARAAGMTSDAVHARVGSGRWSRVHRGVFATFTGPLPRLSVMWAAILASGDGATLSHHSAAELIGLTEQTRPGVHVTIPAHRRVAAPGGITIHHSVRVDAARHPTRTTPQTRVEETVLDLVEVAGSPDDVVGLLSAACGRRLTTPDRLVRALDNRSKIRWRKVASLALDDVLAGCHSVLEVRFLRAVQHAHGLPDGVRQHRDKRGNASHVYQDVRYPELGVVVELDGRVAHPAQSRDRDRRRDNVAAARGDVVMHFGWNDVTLDPCGIAGQLIALFHLRGWRGTGRRCGPVCPVTRAVGNM